MTLHVFAYGSLLDSGSASRALGRPLSDADLIPAVVHGYRRAWCLKEQVHVEALGRVVDAAFLDLRPDPGGSVNGALIALTEEECRMLARREKNYHPVDISDAVRPEGGRTLAPGRMLTFIGRDEHLLDDDDDAVVLERYRDLVMGACARFGGEFEAAFATTTAEAVFPVVGGAYRFVDEHQAKLV